MIAYLDASALVKRYLLERSSLEMTALRAESEMVATSIVTRAEVAAAFAKAARTGLTEDRAVSRVRAISDIRLGLCRRKAPSDEMTKA